MRNLIIIGLIALLIFGCLGAQKATSTKSTQQTVQDTPNLDQSSFAIEDVDSSQDLQDVDLNPPN